MGLFRRRTCAKCVKDCNAAVDAKDCPDFETAQMVRDREQTERVQSRRSFLKGAAGVGAVAAGAAISKVVPMEPIPVSDPVPESKPTPPEPAVPDAVDGAELPDERVYTYVVAGSACHSAFSTYSTQAFRII